MTGKVDHTPEGCFTGDTLIKLSNNISIPIEMLYNIFNTNTKTNTTTINNNLYTKRLINNDTNTPRGIQNSILDNEICSVYSLLGEKVSKSRIKRVMLTKYTADILEVLLDNGKRITCTPNHRFMLNDRTYKQIQYIEPGTVLKSFEENTIIRVKEIKRIKLEEPIPVYDIEVQDNNNFSLDAGIIVHNSKDLLDSLVGSIYSASVHIKPEEIYSLENYSLILEANIDDSTINSSNPVNELFQEFSTKQTTEQDIVEQQNKRIDQEIQTIKKLRSEMTKEENIMFSDQQLLDMLANSTMDDDMLIF